MIKQIKDFVVALFTPMNYDDCYKEMERQGYTSLKGCGGLVGGTIDTVFLSETCIDCPYLVLSNKENKNELGTN